MEHEIPGTTWSLPAGELADRLGVDAHEGLTDGQVSDRRERFGSNELRRHETRSALSILIAQFKSLIIGLLAAASAVAFAYGETLEGWAILAVILINSAIGFFTELRAVRSMEALYELGRVSARVRREGRVEEVDAEDLVPGDVVLLEGGDVMVADLRIRESNELQADESALTGESLPVSKGEGPVGEEAELAGRTGMLYKGTALTRGSGEGLVVHTGMDTELGRISAMVESAEEEATPLEERLDRLGRRLIWVTLGIAAAVTVSGIAGGKELFLMIETGIALAVATIPEGLPIVATIVLARGMQEMARRNALINRLSSVETLGATSIICTDKTGTLTENRMTLTRLALADRTVTLETPEEEGGGPGGIAPGRFLAGEEEVPPNEGPIRDALVAAALCNNASLGEEGPGDTTGDPLEAALLVGAARAGLTRDGLLEDLPEEREVAFDPNRNMMATVHRGEGAFRTAVKGAPEAVFEVCIRVRTVDGEEDLTPEALEAWEERNRELAAEGLRIIALAWKQVGDAGADPYGDLTLLGLACLLDPPRTDVRASLDRCQAAGIRVVMVTGDQALTALGIAEAVGLTETEDPAVVEGKELSGADMDQSEVRARMLDVPVFARVSPGQKLDLIELHQREGRVVAMTGDGVNDAPALKKADIGVAMGRRGTQVAREAADMVLQDDAFSSIVAAVEQGRVIFGNIRRFVYYLLSCNVSEVMVVGLASLVGTVLPILPLQILFLNLVTDIFPALALGMGEGERGVMQRPPRPQSEPILARRHWTGIAFYGTAFTTGVLGALALALLWLELPRQQAITVSFLTLAFAQLWHVFNMRGSSSGFFRNEVTRNRYVWGALGLCILLLVVAVFVPPLAHVLHVEDPGWRGWGVVGLMSLAPIAAGLVTRGRWSPI
ncbi:MAG: cation-transporting P-type ATPase [bacterium]